jgi:hypothetical protein
MQDALILVTSLVVSAFVITVYCPSCVAIDEPDLGARSDALSALLGGLTGIGVLATPYYQRTELPLQRKELKDTRVELKRSAEAQVRRAGFNRPNRLKHPYHKIYL